MTGARPQVSRRAVLSAAGLMLLLAGCDAATTRSAPTGPRSAVPGTGGPVGDSHTTGSAPPEGGALTGGPEFYVHKGPRAIALTIDDGPDPRWTPQILALLERYAVTAVFCQVGQRADHHPALVREVADQGHLLANHTWTHADLARSTTAAVHDEIARTTEVLDSVTGRQPDFFRAPYGIWSPRVLTECRTQGLTPLDWSVDPRDWSSPGARTIVRAIEGATRTGSIILEHDGGGDRSQTVIALQTVLPRLLDQGYRFVTP